MLLGAWPIGGVKHSSQPNPNDKSGKCRFISLCGSYALFLIIGAAIFSAIEGPRVDKYERELIEAIDKFSQSYPCINHDELEKFIGEVLKASSRGISALRNATSEPNWTFGQALFFSTTVVTTIGYGHVTPLSQTGKLFCLLYAMIGIPLTLVLLSAAVERLMTPVNWLLGSLNSRLGHLYQPFNIRILHLIIVIIIVLILFFGIPVAIFTHMEDDWTALDAFYYCFISLTTIGLGDYIPGDDPDIDYRSIYKIGTTCYLILGLIAIMLSLNVFYDIPQLNLGQLFTESRAANFGESEKLRSTHNPCYSGPTGLYMPQRDEEIRAIVRIRPHANDDSPSPEDPTPMHAKDIRIP
ncbi:potassium channel subfamily K member 1-like isoform X2 [Sitodiplosis mosellana]|uniref:potassium channel subfamily K member 1-like isoform X2 n=1 Tax=Sitodiplosis mosellana TaxID=263140 RepID=UPI002444B888|nr:potassium channel subfamily K member 1-like isoform X2 [Sitodiplosis mosellana]XP_055304768.1 potassium channel subfamily K member 1-like isoform X2 [Sitodiplosis mosellana]XP_055304769.1 potassium channel subfamily K member 1-like isoform X2 [Sitodiplosis mosellana]